MLYPCHKHTVGHLERIFLINNNFQVFQWDQVFQPSTVLQHTALIRQCKLLLPIHLYVSFYEMFAFENFPIYHTVGIITI